MSTSQFTNKEIADYVSAVLGGAGTDAEKAAAINDAAQQYDVTRERPAASTGYGLDVVNQYLGALPTNAGATSTSTGALSTVTTTGDKTYTGGLPTSGFDAYGNPRGDTWTEDRYNPNDPASSRYIADPNAGQFVFDPITGKHTLVSSTGATSVIGATGNTYTENRYNPNDPASSRYIADPNAGQFVFDPITGKHTLVSSTGATSVTGAAGNDIVTGTTSVTGARGNDIVTGATSVTGARGNDTVTGLTSITGAAGNDTVTGAADTSRNNAIKNQFLSIYDDPNKTGYQKAQEIKTLATNAKVSDAEIASALGFTGADGTTLLNTFLNQPDPTTRAIQNAFAGVYHDKTLSDYEKAQKINQLASTNKVSRDQISTALNIDKKNLDAFLDQPNPAILTYTKSIVGNYTDPAESKDLSSELAYFLAQKLTTNGVSSLNDSEKRIIKGDPAKVELGPTEYLFEMPTGESSTGLFRSGPDGYYAINQDQYEIGQRLSRGDSGFTTVAARRKNVTPATPDVTKYFSKTTGKEIDPVLFDDKAGTKYVLTEQGIQKQFDPYAKVAAQASQYIDINSSSGDAWSYFGGQEMVNQIGQRLRNVTGIDDINDLELKTVIKPRGVSVSADNSGRFYVHEGDYERYLTDEEIKTIRSEDVVSGDGMTGTNFYAEVTLPTKGIYNKKTGQLIADQGHSWHGDRPPTINLGGWGEGDGMTYAGLEFDANGKPKITTYGTDSENWVKEILTVAAILAAPYTFGGSLSALGGGEAALLAAEGLGTAGLTTGLTAAELAAADLALGGLGGSAGAASLTAGALPTSGSLVSTLTSALPTELVEAGRTLYNTFNTVKPYLQAGNALYQASQGNIANALLSGIDAAGSFGVAGAKELGQALNAGLAASQGNYFPALNFALNQTGVSSELANTKIAGNFTVGDALKGASFLEALRSENPTVILNSLGSLTGSQDLKVAAAASSLVNTLNNSNATAFDIAMGVSRVSDALNTASRQPPPTGALPTGSQSTVTGALGTDTATGAAGNDVIDEYNVTGGGGALITSGNPTEDQQIAIQQRQNAANQALTDYMGPGNDLSREGFVSQLQSLGFTKDQAEGYAKQADQKINMNLVGADVMTRYSKIDPEFGTPQLDRNAALEEMVAAGFSSDRANEILNGIDAQNAIKLENKLSVQSAYNNLTKGTGTEEQLRSAMTSAGYTDNEINNFVTKGLGILEGSKLTAGEQAQERVSQLPDVRAEISAKPTFSEAYKLARDTYGPDATFNYQGKLYSTATFQENPRLGLVDVAGSGRGTATGKTAEQEAALLNTQQALVRNATQKAVESTGFWSNLSNSISNQMKLSSDAANAYLQNNPNSPITQSVSTALEAAGELQKNVIGGTALMLDKKPVADAFIKGGNELIKLGQSIGTGPQDTKNWNDTLQLIDQATGLEKLGVLAGRVLDGTSGLGRQTVVELRQELPALFLGGGTARGVLVASGLIDTKDTAGGAAIDAYDDAIKTGKNHNDALADARKAGLAAGAAEAAVQLTLGKLGDLAIGKFDNVITKGVGRVGAEGLTEAGQEGGSSLAVDVALGQELGLNKALTQAIAGLAVGKSTATATSPVSAIQDAAEIREAAIDQNGVSKVINNIQTLYGDNQASTLVNNLVGSDNLAAGGQTLANDLSNVMGSDAAVTTANTLVGNLAISKSSDTLQSQGVTLNNLSTVVGKTDSGNNITLGDALGASITGNGQQVAASTVVGTKADGTNLTLGDLSSTIKTGVTTGATTGVTTDATTGITTDATTNAATQTDVTGNVNANTSTTTDANTGVTTNTAVDTNTRTTTTTTTDPNTNTTTQTTVDQNTGVNTQTTTTTDQTSTTTVDTNTNVTTNTTVNTNTNTTTNITVNTNTGEVVVKVIDNDTDKVLDTQIKTVDKLTSSELEKLTITDPTTKTPVTKTPVTKTPVTKPPVATAPKTGSSAGFSMFGEIGRLGTPMLKSAGDTQIKNPLEQLFQSVDVMNQIDPALLAVMTQRLNIQPEQAPTFTYGQETSIDDILGLREPKKPEEALYAEGGYVEPLRAKPMNLQFMNRGGALPGGREDFKGGKHVAGDGDGQSDDIPAWLADGEFVFPADVVSALGNGSTKAGTDKLYKMMHEIRARARSTKVKDLPPPAHKSPLDYIKKGK